MREEKDDPPPPFLVASFSARLNSPYMIAGDAASILVVDRNNHAIRRIFTANLSFADTTLAGVMSSAGSTGNGGPASLARLNNPYSIASDGSGGWLIVRCGEMTLYASRYCLQDFSDSTPTG